MPRDHANYRAWDNARYQRRKDDVKKRAAAWAEKNRDRRNAISRKWAAANVENIRAHSRSRNALRKRASCAWANMRAVRAIYAEARRIETETGVQHHVDHIVPLTSRLVCGLHWEGNLQILPYKDNIVKRNHVWPDMPGAPF